jgi:hypothetical protein
MKHERKSLTDILRGNNRGSLESAWNETQAASEREPLPGGSYVARIVGGELMASRTNATPGYRLTFQVLEGDFAGRQFWLELWLTEAALGMTKRDLAKIGVTSLDQLERPLPQGIRCDVRLALRTSDTGAQFNHVVRFEVVGIDKIEADPFAPSDGRDSK